MLEEPHQPRVIEAGEVVADIRVKHPVHLLAFDRGRERIQRVVRGAPRPESVGEAQEVRLVDAAKHLDHGALKNLVLQRGDPERPQSAVPLGDVRPSHRLRPIAPALHAPVQVSEAFLQGLPVFVPGHAIDAGSGLRLQREVRSSQAIDVDVVQERGELRVLVLLCDLAHATERT